MTTLKLPDGRTVSVDELERVSQAATPGARFVRGCSKHTDDMKALCRRVRAADDTRCDQSEADKQHAAAWDSLTCLALCAAARERERLQTLPEWIIAKLKTMTEYYEPPTDGRDMRSEIQGWMHVLCFHYEQNRREVREFDKARRTAKELTAENTRLADRVAELEGYVHDCPKCGRACKECDCTEKRIAELEGALRPFVETWDDDKLNEHPLMMYAITATVGDSRRAAALLNEGSAS